VSRQNLGTFVKAGAVGVILATVAGLGIVTLVVAGDYPTQPGVVPVVRRPPGLPLAQGRRRLRHRGQSLQDEPELDRHRLLAPQCAVGIEDGDPLGRRHEVPAAGAGDRVDEPFDGVPRRGQVPRRQHGRRSGGGEATSAGHAPSGVESGGWILKMGERPGTEVLHHSSRRAR